ncbi:TfoX/Sxy family protein [Rhodopseudomonas palustris]|nr:TfoX/Sxy family protein [Rhodopseudomonas palustris]MCP9626643.1 TfoX/Sxy family protein [Rhodopseudomonas palustris]
MDRDYLADLFEPFGPVTIRRMFSGFGISADGVTFALVLRDTIYLRADEATIARFESEGSQPFSYTTRQRTVTVASYWRLPDRLLDEPDEMVEWSRAALAAAERAALAKARKPRKAKAGKATSAVRAKTAKGTAKAEYQTAGGSRRAKNAAEPKGKAGAKPRHSPATASRRSRAK